MKKNDVLLIIVGVFIVVLVSVVYNVYNSLATSTISSSLTLQIKPISPTFNTNIIDTLDVRRKVSPQFQATNIPLSPSPTPASATTSGSITTPVATSSGGTTL